MCTVFWDRKSILLVGFLPRGKTVDVEQYWDTLRKLWRPIQIKRCGIHWENFGVWFRTKDTECLMEELCWFITMHVPILLVPFLTLFKNLVRSSLTICHTALIWHFLIFTCSCNWSGILESVALTTMTTLKPVFSNGSRQWPRYPLFCRNKVYWKQMAYMFSLKTVLI